MSLEAALEFWREELETRGGRNFDKEFAYNFKHSYGSVGKRTSYTPYACHKIIDEPAVEGMRMGEMKEKAWEGVRQRFVEKNDRK